MKTHTPYLNLAPVGIWKRAVNFIIDQIPIQTIAYILEHSLLNPYFDTLSNNTLEGNSTKLAVSLAVAFLYYVIWETICGRTLGKFVTRTVVINKNGELPSFFTALYRTLCRFIIPFEFVSFIINEGIGWHDTFPRTRVVDVKEYKAIKSE